LDVDAIEEQIRIKKEIKEQEQQRDNAIGMFPLHFSFITGFVVKCEVIHRK
jgi:hypothetical protein